MEGDAKNPVARLDAIHAERIEMLWADMDDDIRYVLRRKIRGLGPLQAIREIGSHYKDGRWSITPFPGHSGFGSAGLKVSTELVKRLRGDND